MFPPPPAFRSVLLGGSRSLSGPGRALARSLGVRLARAGFSLHVGCAPGADAAAFSGFTSVTRSEGQAVLFAVGGPASGWPGPAPARVSLACSLPRVSVRWWAGGSGSVPLRARLAVRSRAALAGVVAAAWVVSSPSSRGSLGAAAAAAAAGVPVFVFCVGFSPAALPALGPGAWVSSSLLGCPCVRWLPAVSQRELL